MTSQRWQQVKEVVADALERAPGDRAQVVDAACNGDTSLRREVESLLASADDEGELEQVAGTFAIGNQQLDHSRADERVGAYRIVREIGRGGMGTVYLATRADEEFHKEVAVKVLKRGTDTDEVLRRFRIEREILARLEHSYIARLIDAGTAADRLPYFVMEYVPGQPITTFCESQQLDHRARIELFLKVCDAVQFAHRNLVVHRDIKPANILVTPDAEPKLLDFGIAKLLEPDALNTQLTTPERQRLTPGYASPEQVRGETITTLSDVYALGALLYELLTGQSPHRFGSAQPSASELQRVIGETEPPRASAAAPTDDARRALRGDLDNVLQVALRKEADRRYSGVAAFAEDLSRYLNGRPVRARPATAAYYARKFIGRNKVGVAAAILLLLSLVGGFIATAWQARIAHAERARAERRFNDVRRLANSFIFDFHDEIDKGAVKAKQLLVSRALEYLNSLAQEAVHDAELQKEIAVAYLKIGDVQGAFLGQNLGDTPGALVSYGKALAIFEALAARAPASRDNARGVGYARNRLGLTQMSLGKTVEAAEQFRQTLVIFERLLAADPSSTVLRVELGGTHRLLATALGLPGVSNLGDAQGALEHLRNAAALFETLTPEEMTRRETDFLTLSGGGDKRQDLAAIYTDLGEVTRANGDTAAGTVFTRKALALLEAAIIDDPRNVLLRRNTAAVTWNVAGLLLNTGGLDEALELTRKSLAMYEQLAADDPNDLNARKDLAQSYRNMGRVLSARKDIAGALEFNTTSLRLFEEVVAKDAANAFLRRQLALTQMRQSIFLGELGRLDEAIAQAQGAIAIGESLIAADPKNATARNTLALSFSQLGKSHAQSATNAAGAQSSNQWRAAKEAYERSLEQWTTLRDSGALPAADAGKIDEVTREIARCDAAGQ